MRKIALLGLLGALFPTASTLLQDSNKFQPRDFSRSRAGTRSNKKYVHEKLLFVEWIPAKRYPHISGNKFDLVRESYYRYNVPMRRAERKGVPGVPRGFGSIKDISF